MSASREEIGTCGDCGHDTYRMGEYYMLQDNAWLAAMERGRWVRMLCIGCVERRLGHKLRSFDFIECPLNEQGASIGFPQSLRLRDRMRNHA